jgi:hypothetical protein
MKLVCNTAVQQVRAERTRRVLAALNLFVEELLERECRLEGGHQNDGDDYCVRCGVDLQT